MKFKRFMSLLASMAMAVTALTGAMSVSAETDSGECGEGVTWSFDSSTGKLTISGEGEMAMPEVKDEIDPSNIGEHGHLTGYTVDEQLGDYPDIYTYKKEHKEDIKEVVIGDGVTTIGFCAFYKMPNLVTVVLPKTISEFKGIGFDAVVSIDTKPTDISAYASYAFAECTSLKNLTLTEGMTAIGSYAFYGCTALESVKIPSTILYEKPNSLKSNYGWGPYSFTGCTSLKNITLPEGLAVIGGAAFENTGLESVVIPSTMKYWPSVNSEITVPPESNNSGKDKIINVYSSAFGNCKNLSSVTFADNFKVDTGVNAWIPFWGCSSLKRVAIPKSVNKLYCMFAYCDGLEEVYIEDGAEMSGSDFHRAFYYCKNLKKIEIPNGVEIDYTNAEWCKGCSSLQDIYLHGKDYMSARVNALNENAIFHCYPDSNLFTSSSVSNERKVNLEEDLSKARNTLNKKLEDAKALNENDYTAESYAALKTAIENAEKFDENYTGVLPLQWAASDITSATRKLEKKPQPADYTAVDAALAKIPSDLSIYTDETVKALNDAKEAVVRDLTIDEQERVNDFANAIEEAIAGLKKKPNSNTGSDDNNKPQNPNPNNNTNKPNQPTSSKDKGKTPTNKVTVPKPAQVKSVKATAKKKKLNVSWKKVSGATGYEVLYATNNKFTKGKKTVKVKKNKVTLKKLKAKNKYFVKVRAYKKVKGNVSYGKWSKVVKKKTK